MLLVFTKEFIDIHLQTSRVTLRAGGGFRVFSSVWHLAIGAWQHTHLAPTKRGTIESALSIEGFGRTG